MAHQDHSRTPRPPAAQDPGSGRSSWTVCWGAPLAAGQGHLERLGTPTRQRLLLRSGIVAGSACTGQVVSAAAHAVFGPLFGAASSAAAVDWRLAGFVLGACLGLTLVRGRSPPESVLRAALAPVVLAAVWVLANLFWLDRPAALAAPLYLLISANGVRNRRRWSESALLIGVPLMLALPCSVGTRALQGVGAAGWQLLGNLCGPSLLCASLWWGVRRNPPWGSIGLAPTPPRLDPAIRVAGVTACALLACTALWRYAATYEGGREANLLGAGGGLVLGLVLGLAVLGRATRRDLPRQTAVLLVLWPLLSWLLWRLSPIPSAGLPSAPAWPATAMSLLMATAGLGLLLRTRWSIVILTLTLALQLPLLSQALTPTNAAGVGLAGLTLLAARMVALGALLLTAGAACATWLAPPWRQPDDAASASLIPAWLARYLHQPHVRALLAELRQPANLRAPLQWRVAQCVVGTLILLPFCALVTGLVFTQVAPRLGLAYPQSIVDEAYRGRLGGVALAFLSCPAAVSYPQFVRSICDGAPLTALHFAAEEKHEAVVRLLVFLRADVNVLCTGTSLFGGDVWAVTPLDCAGSVPIRDYLRRHGALTAAELAAAQSRRDRPDQQGRRQ